MGGREKSAVEKYVTSLEWIRGELLEMDGLAHPILGIAAWDDAVCVPFGGKKLVVSTDGPYMRRLVLKSALVHAATDVVVKGARPIFCVDNLIGPESDLREMLASLKEQALAMKIPILGGNTLFEDAEPRCSITVVGELMLKEPIPDGGARKGDSILLIGEPIWGERKERLEKAKVLFETWFEILEGDVEIHAAKDVTKGGLASVVYEMEQKSNSDFKIEEVRGLPMTRNLDNFIVCAAEEHAKAVRKICEARGCSFQKIGSVR